MIEKLKDGGPAFPCPEHYDGNNKHRQTPGMTLRDYFAAKAMQGIISTGDYAGLNESISNIAYAIADAMIKARDK